MSRRPIQDEARSEVVVFPDDDLAFRAHVHWALGHAADDPATLQASLHDAYPDARVRERAALAGFGGRHSWYVYRDGTALASRDKDWWTRPDLPEFRIDSTGTYIAANAAAAELVGREIDEIVGMRIGSLTRHEAVDDPGLMAFAALAEEGALESTAVVVRPGGEEVAVRHRLTGDPESGYRMVMVRL